MSVQISASDVNKLRQQTGAGMMDCKKALVEANGDFEAAIDYLRKKGAKVAASRQDRESNEGVIIAKASADKKSGIVVEVNCETDFVAKNADFVALAKDLAELALGVNNKEELLALNYKGITVAEKLIEQTGVIGEKIELGAFEKVEAPFVGSYIHNGNKIAAIVGLSSAIADAAEVSKNLAMQIAAMGAETLSYKDFSAEYIAKETEARIAIIEKENEELHRLGKPLKHVPQYVSYAQLTPEVLAKAEADAKAELKAEGKPEQIWDKILPGKIQRFISDNTTLDQEKALLDQVYIYDESKKVSDFVKSKNVEITSFKRVAL